MRLLEPDEIPLLPANASIDGEEVMFGGGSSGVIIQFSSTDKCMLLEWQDIIRFAMHLLKLPEISKEPEEIDAPTGDD